MSKKSFLLVCCIIVIISGCASTGPIKGTVAGNIIYTNAPANVAFDTSHQALQNLGYKIVAEDRDNFFIRGSYFNPLTGYSPLYGQIKIAKETNKTKISYGVSQSGASGSLDITGYYPRCANNIYKEIAKILSNQGYELLKDEN